MVSGLCPRNCVLASAQPARLCLWLLPLIRCCRAKDGVDDGHVLDGIFERDGDFGVFANGFGESISLDGVLVARRDDLGNGCCWYAGTGAPKVELNICRKIERRTIRHVEADATPRAVDFHALIKAELGAAGEDGLAAGIVEDSGR